MRLHIFMKTYTRFFHCYYYYRYFLLIVNMGGWGGRAMDYTLSQKACTTQLKIPKRKYLRLHIFMKTYTRFFHYYYYYRYFLLIVNMGGWGGRAMDYTLSQKACTTLNLITFYTRTELHCRWRGRSYMTKLC